jgi:hypothetical protein
MSDVTADVSQHFGANSAGFPIVAAFSGDASQAPGDGGVQFEAEGYVGAEASLERWLFGSTSDYDMDDDMDNEGASPMKVRTIYSVECARAGHVAWRERFENMVTTAGLNALLDAAFGAGLVTPAWFVGLVDGANPREFNASDTMAAHGGWAESALYSDATRPAFAPGAISGAATDNSADRAVFHVNGTGNVAGFFLSDSAEISGAGGNLWGAGEFGGGARDVADGDILRVAATISLT